MLPEFENQIVASPKHNGAPARTDLFHLSDGNSAFRRDVIPADVCGCHGFTILWAGTCALSAVVL